MKRKIFSLGLAFLLAFTTLLTACNGSTSSSSVSSEETSSISTPYTIKITAIGKTPIAVSKTVQLRTTVTGTTEKDVTWSSSDETIATVDQNGLVTGVGAGEVKIIATLNIDENCKTEFNLTVEEAAKPTSLVIGGFASTIAWVNEDVNLTVSIEPSDAAETVNWASSNNEVASVENGVVTFLKEGTVTIIATSTVDETIFDAVDFTVKHGTFLTNKGNGKWDLANQANAPEAHISISADDSAGYNPVYFNHFVGQRFYIEATFQSLGNTHNAWDWQGFGVGTGLNDNDARYFEFSPHHAGQANHHNKTILRERPDSWGPITTRSQVWGENNLNSIVPTDPNKIALLRYDNFYYYLINDQVYWFDNTNKYENIDTYPFLFTFDVPVKVTNYKLITDENVLDGYLDSAEYQKSFFAANPNNVNYVDDTNFTLSSTTTLSKDHKVRSLGDKAKLVGNFEIEFEIENLVLNTDRSHHRGITINLTRYDAADDVDTISIGTSVNQDGKGNALIGRFTKWYYPVSMENPNSIRDWFETSEIVKSDPLAKSTVKITRTIENDIAYFKLFVDGVEYTFDLGAKGEANGAYSTYTGAYLIWVAGEYASCKVSNFVFRSL